MPSQVPTWTPNLNPILSPTSTWRLDRLSFARQRCAVTRAPRLLHECVALDLTSFRSDSADGGRTLGKVPTVRDTPVDGSLCTLDDQILSTLTFPPSCSDDEVGEPVGGDDTPTTPVRLWRTELENENGHSKPLKDNGVYMAIVPQACCLWLRTVD